MVMVSGSTQSDNLDSAAAAAATACLPVAVVVVLGC